MIIKNLYTELLTLIIKIEERILSVNTWFLICCWSDCVWYICQTNCTQHKFYFNQLYFNFINQLEYLYLNNRLVMLLHNSISFCSDEACALSNMVRIGINFRKTASSSSSTSSSEFDWRVKLNWIFNISHTMACWLSLNIKKLFNTKSKKKPFSVRPLQLTHF